MHAPLGILMLDTTFDRPVGDAGNPKSWPFPVIVDRVPGAYARPIVKGESQDITPFVTATKTLVEKGAGAIITTCGFLVRHQKALDGVSPVPVLTSTLTQFQRLQRELPTNRRLAVLTIDVDAFDESVRCAANIGADALVFGTSPHSHFVSAILDSAVQLDVRRAEREWVDLAQRVQGEHPEIGAWLFECANMPPYSDAVRMATGLPVYDTLSMGIELREALVQK